MENFPIDLFFSVVYQTLFTFFFLRGGVGDFSLFSMSFSHVQFHLLARTPPVTTDTCRIGSRFSESYEPSLHM